MTKKERLNLIKNIICDYEISTQEELTEKLNELGHVVSQATVSRDINDLNLIKVNGKTKKSIYVLPKIEGNSVSPKIIELFRQVTLSIEAANNLLVIKTLAGNAGTAGMAIDHMGINNILGTIAGDDTLLIVAKTEKDAKIIEKGLKKI
jgi:transcriptional regulator of arginine metabolism